MTKVATLKEKTAKLLEMLSELMREKINAMDDASFVQYLRFHDYICEKPECLGMSNHLLFVGEPGK